MNIVIAFFLLGAFAKLVHSNIQFPKSLYQSITLYLMLAIGLKGGIALASHANPSLAIQSLWVLSLGIILPLLAFPILSFFGGLNRLDSASIAAHYGSVSVGTYAIAVAVLESQDIAYEAYFPLFVVLLEMPAIAVGLLLAKRKQSKDSEQGSTNDSSKLVHEVLCNQGMVLMTGGIIIGYFCHQQFNLISPVFSDLFQGMLALFLFEMGMVAASQLKRLKEFSHFIIAFGIAMPLVGAIFGAVIGHIIDLSTGGVTLLAVLGASASYIAVPASMRIALPEANNGLAITASLGITFPFNVIIGIPVYLTFSAWLTA